jgi:2-polyprenyl-6-methoxyphenol hydroxylase-like FAD-dependent oxidoreductase
MNVNRDVTANAPRDPARPATRDAARAVVIGASMAGLLAARILSERFAEVWLLERDELPDAAAARKGTPHAMQPHGLLARGRQIIEELFPGFTDALVAQGGLCGDVGLDVVFDADRSRMARQRIGCVGVLASRLAIEAELRRRVRRLPGVRLMTQVDVVEPAYDAASRRVTGVRLVHRDGGAACADTGASQGSEVETVAANLVVDCSGRGSRSLSWLDGWGFEPAFEERVRVDLSYTSAYFLRDEDDCGDVAGVISTATPGLPRPAVLLAQEPDPEGRQRWVAAVGGYGGDHPEVSLEGMRARARAIGGAELIAVTERGRLLGPVMRYRFPHSQRRHYERMARFPAGYLVMGDALASFNPIYGQGMTVAACEALELRAALRRGLDGLAPRFFRAAAKVIDVPWQTAVGSDLALPMVPGPRPLPVRLVNAYIAHVYRAAATDPVVATAFLKVMHMLSKPPSLMGPGVMWRVFRASGRAAGGVAAPATAPAGQLQVP